MNDAELLPICDILFVISSLLIYFCDVLFSLLLAYALFLQDMILWPCVLLSLVLLSSTFCQGFSFKWHVRSKREYLRNDPAPDPEPLWLTHTIVFVHCLQVTTSTLDLHQGHRSSPTHTYQTSAELMTMYLTRYRSPLDTSG